MPQKSQCSLGDTVNDPKEPGPIEPVTGVRPIASDEFAKKVAAQLNGGTNGTTNGAHHPEPDDSFWAQGEDVSFAPFKDARSDAERHEDELNASKIPPHNDHAEACVIISEIFNPSSIPKLRTLVSRSDFYSESNALIHEACVHLHDEGKSIDETTVLDRLVDVGATKVVKKRYWDWLLSSVPVRSNVTSHAEIVAKTAQLRRISYACDTANFAITRGGIGELSNIIEALRSTVETFRPRQSFQTPNDVIIQWSEDGPLIHEPTGIPPLDNATGGGPVYGSRWIVNGAPDAGKTALLVQIAHTYALRGVAVGFLAADEESSDLQTRFAQRTEFSRLDCEIRNPNTLGLMREAFGGLPVRFYRADMTIEAASDDLALWAKQRGSQAALFVDSIQTVVCSKVLGTDDISTRELVTENVRALKNCAMRHKLIALATSEMNRAAYKNGNTADQNDIASGAESRAIEYLARVLVTLRSVKGEPDLVEVAIPKNKHGRSGENFFLRIDRRRMALFESEGPCAPDAEAAKEDERALKERQAIELEATRQAAVSFAKQDLQKKEEVAMVDAVREQPGIGSHELRAVMAAKLGGCSRNRADDCLARLRVSGRIRIEDGGRNHKQHFLNEDPCV